MRMSSREAMLGGNNPDVVKNTIYFSRKKNRKKVFILVEGTGDVGFYKNIIDKTNVQVIPMGYEKKKGISAKDNVVGAIEMLNRERTQGVVAIVAAYEYGTIEDLFKRAEEKGEDPFFILLDGIEDPHNLGAIIRTANLAGAHGVIIPKHRAVGITPTVAKTSAGAINYTPVVKVTNIGKTMDELKERGMWFACADMDGEVIYRQNLTGSIGLVIGNEGSGVSRLVKEKCDFISSIPMKGDIDSLNASVAAGVLAFEVVRQRLGK